MVKDGTFLDSRCVIAWLEEEYRPKGSADFTNMEEKCVKIVGTIGTNVFL